MIFRLLPWPGPDGQPCFLARDEEGETSALWRLADEMESVRLGIGRELLGYVRSTLAEAVPGETELTGMVAHLCMALTDVMRVAESRGARLGVPDT